MCTLYTVFQFDYSSIVRIKLIFHLRNLTFDVLTQRRDVIKFHIDFCVLLNSFFDIFCVRTLLFFKPKKMEKATDTTLIMIAVDISIVINHLPAFFLFPLAAHHQIS
nr:MAG TPA: hypothetical protein [Bacteriophage sp.]